MNDKTQAEIVASQRLVVAQLENELAVAREALQKLEIETRGQILAGLDWDAKKLGPNEAAQKLHFDYEVLKINQAAGHKTELAVSQRMVADLELRLNLAKAILQGAIDLLDDQRKRERNAVWHELIARLDGDEIKGLLQATS